VCTSYDFNEIAEKIAQYQEQIQQLQQRIAELMCLPVLDANGDVKGYGDL
jgi:DNA-binding protein YbaB